MDAKTSAMCRTSPVAATASTDATSSARPAAFASVSRACSIRAFTLSTDASVRTESRDAPSASSRRRKMPWMRDCRLFVSCSTRSISATARGMRRRPETDCSSSAREMSSAMSWSFISTSARCFSTCSGSWDGHLRSRAAEGGEVSDRRSGDEEAKRAESNARGLSSTYPAAARFTHALTSNAGSEKSSMEIDIVAVPRRAALALDTATPALLPRARDPHFKSHDFSRVPVFEWSVLLSDVYRQVSSSNTTNRRQRGVALSHFLAPRTRLQSSRRCRR